MINYIKSSNNDIIKLFRSLRNPKYRDKFNLFTVEGLKLVKEAFSSNFELKFVILTDKTLMQVAEIENLCSQRHVPQYIVTEQLFNKISDTISPQGVAAAVKIKDHCIDDVIKPARKSFFVITDMVQDPGNLGGIIRSADATGADAVFVLKGSVDVYNPKTIRATMGSIFHLPVIRIDDKQSILNHLKSSRVSIIASSLNAKSLIFEADFSGPIAVVVGNESCGVSREILSFADTHIKIPLVGKAESYNVAVAAGIVMYEVMRQRYGT